MARELTEEEQFRLEEELDTFSSGEKEINEQYTYAEETIKEFERLGIVSMPRPKMAKIHETVFPDLKAGTYYDGRMPLTMKQLTLDEVSMLLSLTNNWYGYLVAQYSLYAAQRSEAKRKRDAIWSKVRNEYRKIFRKYGQSASDQKCSDLTRQDARFIEAENAYERLNVIYDGLFLLSDHTKKTLDVVSREVTIRQAKTESEARHRGIANRFNNDTRRAAVPSEDYQNDSTQGNTPRKIYSKIRSQ